MAKNKSENEKELGGEIGTISQKDSSEGPEQEMVSVPKAQLTDILAKLERLESVADVGRLESFDNAHKTKALNRVRLNVLEAPQGGEPKVIMAWKMTVDEVVYNNGRYIDRQVIELTLEDDSKVQLDYREFAIGKKRSQQVAELISRQKDEQMGTEIMKLRRLEDQKEFNVDSRFVN
jgi:hypothetical protein